jgi:SM-20-related protein
MSDRATPFRFFNAVFTEDTRKSLYEFLQTPGWETSWRSNSKRDAFTFLHKHFAGFRKDQDPYDCEEELGKNAPPVYLAWLVLRGEHLSDRTLVRCYANGMMYGMDGTVHVDAHDTGNDTFVYYPHERWSPNWGGETIFYNREESGVVGCSYPRPNSAVMFDGRIPHRANGVTRLYPGVRITLMFKVRVNAQPAA